MNGELLRLIDAIHRDKDIDREVIFQGIESALTTAAKKRLGTDEILVEIDRDSGSIIAHGAAGDLEPGVLGRIAAQTAKQVILQKIREAERDVIYSDYETKKHDLVTGTIARFEGPNVIIQLGKTEGILPKREQVPDEIYNVGDRLRCYVLDVKKVGQRVRIILSRAHPDFIRRLFELEVPELAEHIIEIKALVRESGYRTKIAVASIDQRVDCVGACVGVRGSRIRTIIDELNGEKIDIIRWSESAEVLLMHALKPAHINQIVLDEVVGKARVIVEEDQLSLAIGRRGQNVRLASRLTGWEIDILSPDEYVERQKLALQSFERLPSVTPEEAEVLLQGGYLSLREIGENGPEALAEIEGFDQERAEEIVGHLDQTDLTPEDDAIKAIGRGGPKPPPAPEPSAEGEPAGDDAGSTDTEGGDDAAEAAEATDDDAPAEDAPAPVADEGAAEAETEATAG
ncbi:MAG: transcription termination factor NusA [Planctomycetota bacterium]|jgi:N utilization substance protein A